MPARHSLLMPAHGIFMIRYSGTFGARLQDVFAKPLPSCASHLPAALCMGVATATSSFQSLFYIY